MARSEDHATVGLAALPDAPVALVRLDDGGRILAVNRAAVDLLDLAGLADGALDCSCVWGLAPADLQGEEGVWVAPGADPARRVCYQHDRDGGGWLLSLPDAETAALWRERAGPAPVPAPAPAQEDGAARLLARVGDRLAACELELALDADLAAQPQARRLAAGFGNLAEAIRQAVALSLQVASEVPRVVAENDEMVRQSQAQVEALATVEAATRDLLSGLDGIGRDLRAVTEVAASADDSVREATAAARDVGRILGENGAALGEGEVSARRSEDVLGGIGELLGRAGTAVEAVAQGVRRQGEAIVGIDRAVARVAGLGRSNLEHAARVAERSEALGAGASALHDCVGLFRLPADPLREPRHARAFALASDAAARVGAAFGHALAQGWIDEASLFSRDYVRIEGIEPPRYETGFDALCDDLLPPLQEPVANAHPWIVFAICANPDGYVPTHNDRFRQPLTGDPARDLVGNRTKRIFDDRVGRSVGAHTDRYRLQVYRRDTGQIMFDLSVPIHVDGRHWGGFRIGYTLD